MACPVDRLTPLLAKGVVKPASRVRMPGTLTVRDSPALTAWLDCELARLQDQGTGGMAPRATLRPEGEYLDFACWA